MIYPSFTQAVHAMASFAYQKAMQHDPITDADIEGWEEELSSYFKD